jgi:hypothetical protein
VALAGGDKARVGGPWLSPALDLFEELMLTEGVGAMGYGFHRLPYSEPALNSIYGRTEPYEKRGDINSRNSGTGVTRHWVSRDKYRYARSRTTFTT